MALVWFSANFLYFFSGGNVSSADTVILGSSEASVFLSCRNLKNHFKQMGGLLPRVNHHMRLDSALNVSPLSPRGQNRNGGYISAYLCICVV